MKIPAETSRQDWKQVVFLFLATLFIRLPFFTKDYIDRDESTFILMGQSVADGYLPYVYLWDLKPPLLFYIFGLIESVFPYSIEAIRFTGVLVVFTAAVVFRKIMIRGGMKNSFPASIALVMLSSEFGNLQGLMSEHLAVFFLLPGLYFFMKGRLILYWLSGLFFGAALLCKLSFAHGIFLLVLADTIINWNKKSFASQAVNVLVLGLGIIIPFILIALPYMIKDHEQLFIDSVFRAPLEYAAATRLSLADKFSTTWWIILSGLFISILAWNKRTNQTSRLVIYSIALLMGTIYTFFSSGIVNGHYLVLVYPFLLILLFGVILPSIPVIRYALLSLIVILLSFESLAEYARVSRSFRDHGHPYYSNAYVITEEIKKMGLEKEKIFFVDYHIGYWMLRSYPLTKSTTHPSNIDRAFLFKYFGGRNTGLEEMRYLLDTIRPELIVSKTPGIGFIRNEMETKQYFDSVLARDYKPMYIRPEKSIYTWIRK